MMYTIFVHMMATKEWLSLSREQRAQFVQADLGPILAQHEQVTFKFYDVEAFSARCSDIAVFETNALDAYASLMDAIRDSKIFTVPYFHIVDIFPARTTDFV